MEDSGILSIAFTLGNLFMCLGKFGMRNFQVTDTDYEFTPKLYYKSRVVTLLFMFMALVLYLLFSYFFLDYTFKKVLVVFSVSLIFGLEVVEDVFVAEFQRKDRLDIGLSLYIVRWCFILAVWSICIILSKNILISAIAGFSIGLIVFMIFMFFLHKIPLLQNPKKNKNDKSIKMLLMNCMPLCLSSILSIYLPHCGRYAIDFYMDDSSQAIFSYISMPIFAISLATMIIFQPMLKRMAVSWNQKDYRTFKRKFFQICGIIIIISFFVFILGFFFESPVLSFLYAIDLSPYHTEMMILLFAGSALAYINFCGLILVIFRKQKILMLLYSLIFLFSIFIMKIFVVKLGFFGITLGNTVILLILAGILFIYIMFYMEKYYKNK